MPLLEGEPGKAIDPPTELAQPAEGSLDFSSDSSIGSESGDVVEVTGPDLGAGSVRRRQRCPVRKVATSKMLKVVAQPKGRRASVSGAEGERDVPEEVARCGRTDVATL
jgi:hypothetical protein